MCRQYHDESVGLDFVIFFFLYSLMYVGSRNLYVIFGNVKYRSASRALLHAFMYNVIYVRDEIEKARHILYILLLYKYHLQMFQMMFTYYLITFQYILFRFLPCQILLRSSIATELYTTKHDFFFVYVECTIKGRFIIYFLCKWQ